MGKITKETTIFEPELLRQASLDSFKKLNPLSIWRNPVMFLVEIGSIITTLGFLSGLFFKTGEPSWFTGAVSLWLWMTVIFSTFAESLAEGRGKARAESLRKTRTEVMAKKLVNPESKEKYELISSANLRKGDCVLVETGEIIPSDGEVVEGAALVNESSVTGESAPVVRESGGDRSAVTGGTKVISNQIIVRITANPGEAFLDRMITMVEGAKRRKTPNEIALEVLIISLTAVFFLVVVNFNSLSVYSVKSAGQGMPVSSTVLIALFVCLAPTTIAALLPAIGIAGMDRLFAKNVIALSGRAIEASGDVDILLLDKTGTITLGDRQAVEFIPVTRHTNEDVAKAALFASMTDETPEGRSVVVLAKHKYQMRISELPHSAKSIPFTAQTRMSGVDIDGQSYRKGASSAIIEFVKSKGEIAPPGLDKTVESIAKSGGTPLVVCHNAQILGVIHLKDILKGGIRERFVQLRKMGIKTVMITGDNHLTAAAIAAEAGVDDFLSEAKPEDKLRLIRENQQHGHMVAMTGDGTNDAPALAQADVAVAMNTGTQAAKEAGNMVDLDSNPTKLLEVVEIGKQLLMTRGVLTTFSIANDVAKYFAIIPAIFAGVYPEIAPLNIMRLATPHSAILSAVIFNALIIVLLIPLALRGVQYRPMGAAALLRRSLVIYGGGGVIIPFAGIKLIDLFLEAVGLV